MKKGNVVIGDPVSQYLATLGPGKKPKLVVVAKESQGLRAVYPLINRVGEVELLLDSGLVFSSPVWSGFSAQKWATSNHSRGFGCSFWAQPQLNQFRTAVLVVQLVLTSF